MASTILIIHDSYNKNNISFIIFNSFILNLVLLLISFYGGYRLNLFFKIFDAPIFRKLMIGSTYYLAIHAVEDLLDVIYFLVTNRSLRR